MYDLALVSVFQNEAAWLREWLEFHLLCGVQHALLYDNQSTDASLEVLKPYVARGLVTIIPWPGPFTGAHMIGAFHNGVTRMRGVARWVACIDTDEFLVSPTEPNLVALLADYERRVPNIGALSANWLMFGTSNVPDLGERLLIETLVRRAVVSRGENRHVKSLVRPDRVAHMSNQHFAMLHAGYVQLSCNGTPFGGAMSPYIDCSTLRVHHYWTRTESYVPVKAARRARYDSTGGPGLWPALIAPLNAVEDRTACTARRYRASNQKVRAMPIPSTSIQTGTWRGTPICAPPVCAPRNTHASTGAGTDAPRAVCPARPNVLRASHSL